MHLFAVTVDDPSYPAFCGVVPMMSNGPLVVCIDDVVRLRKPHPCGSFEWTVVRLGADIGLRCHGCGHKVLLSRRTLEKRLKAFLSRGPDCVGPGPTEAAVAAEIGGQG